MSRSGHNRERQVKNILENRGWWVVRAAGSLGDVDLVALQPYAETSPDQTPPAGACAQFLEVKANKGSPYMHFGPAARKRLLDAARQAGAVAWLVHWPPYSIPKWIHESDWP